MRSGFAGLEGASRPSVILACRHSASLAALEHIWRPSRFDTNHTNEVERHEYPGGSRDGVKRPDICAASCRTPCRTSGSCRSTSFVS